MENCLAAERDDPYRGHAGPLALERGPATNPLFEAFFEAVQQAGYPLHRRRQRLPPGGLRAVRPQHPQRATAVGGPRLPAPGDEAAEPGGDHPRVRRARRVRRQAGGRGRVPPPVRRATQARATPARSCCAAVPSTPRSCCSSRASATPPTCRPSASTCVHDLPGVGEQPAGPPRGLHPVRLQAAGRVQPYLKWRYRPWIGAKWLFLRRGPGATNHFEGGGFVRSNDDVAYPNLMFHFLPIAVRYDGSSPAGGHGYQVHVGPMYSDARGTVKITSRDPTGAPGAAVQLPVDRSGPPRVGRGDPGGPRHPEPAGDATRSTAARSHPDRASTTDEQILDWVRARRRDGAAPVVHRQDGHGRRWRSPTRRRWGCTASRACGRRRVGDALRHQRQHLRAGDDDRREGRRPDPGQHAAASPRQIEFYRHGVGA